MKRKLGILLAVAALLSLGAGLGFLFLVGSYLIAPARASVHLPEAFKGTEVSFPSASGATLKGNYLEGKSGQGVVILMHGVRSHRGGMIPHAQLLSRHGFSVLIFDFQAHGESSGSKITSGYLESMDATAAVRFVKTRAPGEKVAVLGSSLGGAAAVLASPPLPVDAVVLELVYADIERAVKNRIAIVLGDWARLFSPLLTLQIKHRLGIDPESLSPVRAIPRMTCPKLILAGANDRHTLAEDTQALFEAAREPKELWIVPEAGHQSLYRVAPREYEQRIIAFLKNHLSSGQTR